MKLAKKFSIALLTLPFVFNAALAQTQNIPIPASSVYNNAYAVVAVTIPAQTVLPSDLCTASNTNCYTRTSPQPTSSGVVGSYCGRVAMYTDDRNLHEQTNCLGSKVLYYAYSSVWQPPVAAHCEGGEVETCYPAKDGYYATERALVYDCPGGYAVTTTGSAGPWMYYACIKQS